MKRWGESRGWGFAVKRLGFHDDVLVPAFSLAWPLKLQPEDGIGKVKLRGLRAGVSQEASPAACGSSLDTEAAVASQTRTEYVWNVTACMLTAK